MIQRITLGLLALVLIIGCDQSGKQTKSGSASGAESTVLATLNGEAITEGDIESLVASRLQQIELDLYETRKAGLDQLIAQRLLEQAAAKKNVSINELLQEEAGQQEVSDAEMKAFYDQRKDRFQGKKFDEVKELIRGFIGQQKARVVQSNLIAKLQNEADIKYHIEAPRIAVEPGNYPSRGPDSAPVVVIEFSDYQCPFCGRSRPTVKQILDTYGDKVKYVFRDFPLSFHREAQKAHEAAHCAGEQGKYWEYNDKLFASQRALSIDDLKKYAEEFELNDKDFSECLDSGKYEKMVRDSLSYGQSVGVQGTPAFFVNGRMLSGARPFSAFQEVIDDELSR